MTYTKEQAKEEISGLIKRLEEVMKDGKERDYSEADVGSKFILPLIEKLGWSIESIDEVKEQKRTLIGPVDYSLNIDKKPKILIELKKFGRLDDYRIKGGKKQTYPEQAIDYAWSVRADWAVLTNFKEIRLYYSHVKKPEEGLIFKLSFSQYLEEFDKLWILSKESVVSGVLDTYEKKRTREDIDVEVLKDLYESRILLTKNIHLKNPELDKSLLREWVQKVLDRLIVIRVAEDRNIIPSDSISKQLNTWKETVLNKEVRTFMMDLKNSFRDFDSIYNTQLFEEHPCEDLKIDNHVIEEIITRLYKYNFEMISSDVLGGVYESYIGHILKESEEDIEIIKNKEVRKSFGIYYTPTYVVDYIVKNTLGVLLKNKTPEEVSKIRVLDPACGSGSFLIKAFDYLKGYYDEYNKKVHENARKNNEIVGLKDLIPNVEKKILTENLYGVDLDEQAAEIASVNLMLKALKKEERLPLILDGNIKVGNSLVSGSTKELEAYFEDVEKEKPFNWEKEFKDVFLNGGFDVVIGNPPYVPIDLFSDEDKDYYFSEVSGYQSPYRKFDTSILFIERGISLLKEGGLIGFIVPLTWQTGDNYVTFRKIVFSKCILKCVINLPFDVFSDAYVDTGIFILQKVRKEDNIFIAHSYDKKKKINRIDDSKFQKIPQRYIDDEPDNKVFANKFIYTLFKNLEKGSKPLGEITDSCQGVVVSKYLIKDYPSSDSYKKLLTEGTGNRYFFEIKEIKYIDYGKEMHLYQYYSQPRIFIRRTINRQDRVMAFYYEEPLITKKDYNPFILSDDDYNLKYLLALINSKLFSFVYTHSSIIAQKDDFRQTTLTELRKLPVKIISKKDQKLFIELVDKILIINKQKNALLNLFKDLIKKSRQSKDFRPLSYYYTTKKTISLENYTENKEEGKYGINKYGINIVKSQELIDYKEKGKVIKIDCKEHNNFLILKVQLEDEKDFVDMLKICFEDDLVMRFFHFSINTYLLENERKKYWSKEGIWEVLDEIKIPRSEPNKTTDVKNIKQLMNIFEEAYQDKLSTEFKESPVKELNLTKIEEEIEKTDNQIDQKVYELYGLTEEEIEIIEKSL